MSLDLAAASFLLKRLGSRFGACIPILVYIFGMPSPAVETEIRRLTQLLESVLRYRGAGKGLRVGVRALEKKLGWGAGMLSRVLQGKLQFRVRHLLEVLEALEIPPADFFALAYRKEAPSATAKGLLNALGEQGFRGGLNLDQVQGEETISEDEIDERILEALRRISFRADNGTET
jgi:transcriptional regulator with XRE-family HTH domain